jgi:molybdenum cofactor cytidylyltransferase
VITGLLLAAGHARRFGGDKLLAPLENGEPVAIAALTNLAPAVDELVAVLRPGSVSLARALLARGASVICCEQAERGMSHSLACAVAATPAASAWLVALADMPWIPAAACQAVADALREGAPLAAPSHHGRLGHPVGFHRRFGRELRALQGDRGARVIVQRHWDLLRTLPGPWPGILLDVDRPEDLWPPPARH